MKAAAKPKAKVAAVAPATAKAAVAKGKTGPGAKPAVKLNTVEEKKMFIRNHELKIEDKEEEARMEPNRAAKKELEAAVAKLKDNETYKKCILELQEAVLEAAKTAERASINKGAAASVADSAKPSEASRRRLSSDGIDVDQTVSPETFAEIDALFKASGKDATSKASAVEQLEKMKRATPYVVSRLEQLIAQFDNGKLGPTAIKAACAIVDRISPKGHAVASTVVPLLIAGMSDKKWKVKAGSIEVVLPALRQMLESTPLQLSQSLPLIVPKLAECALDVRSEVRNGVSSVLREIGTMVSSPEIKKLSQDLVTALAEPTNQKHTQAVLAKMGNQTFLSLIDAASLSLLMPVVVRGMKERDASSKKWSVQIFGSAYLLVKDLDSMMPYHLLIHPLLQQALSDPVQEVQREAAKCYGILEHVVPEYSREHNQAWLFQQLRKGEIGEQIGASLALAEVFLKMDPVKAAAMLPEIEAGVRDENLSVRRGFLELMDAMPQAMKMEFVPYIQQLFPVMVMGINGEADVDEDRGLKASLSLVARFGDLCPELLTATFETVFAATLPVNNAAVSASQQSIRENCVLLLGKTVEKVMEHKKFGQDILATDCSTKEAREFLAVLMFLIRYDVDATLKRYANSAWKEACGTPKMQKAITGAIEKELIKMRSGALGLGAQQFANKVYEELSEEFSKPENEVAEAEVFKFNPPVGLDPSSEAAAIASGKGVGSGAETGVKARAMSGNFDVTYDILNKNAGLAAQAEQVREYCEKVVTSVVQEGKKAKKSGKAISKLLAEALEEVLKTVGPVDDDIKGALPSISDQIARATMGDAFDAVAANVDDDSEVLLSVDDLLLMYGAGHLLLKGTTLEMKKNHRYGVVGHNGAGKTTLMKEIVDHRIVGMPKDLKCVHVDDSKLTQMSKSCLTCLEYVMKMAQDIGVTNAGRETLLHVGFPEKELDKPVSDLSTGWRMRLTLAVSMLKHADLVLLDEPTNHLDEESVSWLSDYILSIKDSSVMVISHEPKFLNRVCTDIMAYVDKKLEYTAGDFTAFAAKKGLTASQIDAMLSGNLSFDTKVKDEEEEAEEGAVVANKPVAGPPKLSFPIPGSMGGMKTGSKPVLECKNLSFRYGSNDYLFQDATLRLSLNARVAICGRNGCGKSTLMTLLCSEAKPSENADGSHGEVLRHCNLRLAYMKQDHLKALGPFFDTSPFVYITTRFKDGYDGDLQKRLLEPEDEEEALRRANLAKEHGKYGNEVGDLLSRSKIGTQLAYEVQWAGLDDPKQNTMETISKLRMMGLEKVVIACDERIAAKAAGLDQRPLTRREVIKHCEAFGIDEEMACNRQIRGFSAGQKVRCSLAAMFWTKPHLICLDEPTNYLDVETVEALAKALNTFRGGILMIEPKTDFVEKICNEKWIMDGGKVTVEKLDNGAKRQA